MARTEPIETESGPALRWLDDEEAREEFDGQARTWLGISGEAFLRRWDAGDYHGIEDDPDHPFVMSIAMLIPLVRP